MTLNSGASPTYFISTPLVPDVDHDSVPEVFGEKIGLVDGRQVPRANFQVSDLIEDTGQINRMRNGGLTYTVIAGVAFNIEAGNGYEVLMGGGLANSYALRLTGYVSETAITVPVTKKAGLAVRWMAYSLPRSTTLNSLGLTAAVTPWNALNRVRLLPAGATTWLNYQYNATINPPNWPNWYQVSDPNTPVDPALVPGMGIYFNRAGLNDLTDTLTENIWYFRPPNNW
jgi:hypothetical protein